MGMKMTKSCRDDAPEEFSLARRTLVIGGILSAGSLVAVPRLGAQSIGATALEPSSKFMELSSLLIDHHLDAGVGARLAAAMKLLNPGLDQDIDSINEIAKKKNAKIVEDFFADIPDGHLRETALAMIAAWYTGVVADTSDAEVFAYELALMYQPTRDVMTIPSYAISGPNGWSAHAPPLDNMPTF
jgi:hypothetical protein